MTQAGERPGELPTADETTAQALEQPEKDNESGTLVIRIVPWRKWANRTKIIVLATGAAIALVIVLLATGVFGQGKITVHGTFEVAGDVLQSSQNYPDISDGTQVVVVDPSGKVIGTGQLSYDAKATAVFNKALGSAASLVGGETFYDFTVTVPSGESRYGIEVSHRGTIWFTPEQMQKGPGLSIG